jgi:integrase
VLAEYGERHAPTVRRPAVIGIAIDKLTDFWTADKVAAITPARCADYVAWRTAQTDGRAKINGRPVKAATARRELVVLAAALSWCWKEGKLDRAIPVRLPAQAEPRERHLTRAEAARLLAGALGWDVKGKRHHARINRHLARFIMLGLYTGTRHDALLKLQWAPNTFGGWIDLEARILYRRPADAIDAGKRRPTIPLPPRLTPHLRRWRKLTARFVIEWQGLPIRSQERRAWRRARELAGLDAKVTPHILRHTCATWLLQRGVSIYDVAGVLGCGENVVRRTYGHHAQDHLRAAVAAFSRRV